MPHLNILHKIYCRCGGRNHLQCSICSLQHPWLLTFDDDDNGITLIFRYFIKWHLEVLAFFKWIREFRDALLKLLNHTLPSFWREVGSKYEFIIKRGFSFFRCCPEQLLLRTNTCSVLRPEEDDGRILGTQQILKFWKQQSLSYWSMDWWFCSYISLDLTLTCYIRESQLILLQPKSILLETCTTN